MRLLRIVPENTHFGFMKNRFISFTLSGTLAVLSIILFLVMGLNYGIDFKGGTVIEIATKNGPANIGDIRSELSELRLGDVQVQEFGAPNDVLIRIERQQGGEEAQQKAIGLIRDTFGDTVDFRRVEVVGPRVSGELAQAGTLAVLVSLFAVLVYIWFRFEWQFALGAVVATVHDVILTIGMFAVLRLDFTLSSIAAILTIVGYSLNDTVVVYDRIREDMRKYKKMPLLELLDRAINQTLSRTTMTSFTTLLALVSLYTFGGEVIRSFTFAMIWGVLVGTYSSIFVAAPVLNFLNLRRGSDASDGKAEKGQAKTA